MSSAQEVGATDLADTDAPVAEDTNRPSPPATRWVLSALFGYSFSQAPAMTILTAVTIIVAGAVPVGITLGIGGLVNGLTSAIGHGWTPRQHWRAIGSAALLTQATWGLGLVALAVFVVIHSRLVRNYRIAAVETVSQST